MESIKRAFLAACLLVAASAAAATRYDSDGMLSDRLELERWYINHARFDPEAEADRLCMTNTSPGGHPDYDCCEDWSGVNDFGTTTSQWAVWKASKPPLAPNARLSLSTDRHSQDMARVGVLTHPTPPGSPFYPVGSNGIWRARVEGYTNGVSGYYENLAYGGRATDAGYPDYGRTPTNVHAALYTDTNSTVRGHRQAILNANAREIGLGHCRTNEITTNGTVWYWTDDYDTQDFGLQSTGHFFTGTLFNDTDMDGVYDEGEGVGGIQLRLWDGTNQAAWYDESQASGSFAIPINDLGDGRTIFVQLVNTGVATRTVTIPLGYNTLGELTLTSGAAYDFGTFTQPDGITNIGFRNLAPLVYATVLAIDTAAHVVVSSLGRVEYSVESLDSLSEGVWTNFDTRTAGGSSLEFIDTGQGGRPPPSAVNARSYRVILNRD